MRKTKPKYFWDLPNCECPKIDNRERIGCDVGFIFNMSCPVHKPELEKPKIPYWFWTLVGISYMIFMGFAVMIGWALLQVAKMLELLY